MSSNASLRQRCCDAPTEGVRVELGTEGATGVTSNTASVGDAAFEDARRLR